MSRYLEIIAVSRPAPIGVDTNTRTMFSCNLMALAAQPVAKWEEELARVLFDAGLIALGTDGFIGPDATLPKTNGPLVSIIDTGGSATLESHDSKYERLSAQIVVRALSYRDARTRALAIWRALDGVRNVTITAA
jgi:hypothetical protein